MRASLRPETVRDFLTHSFEAFTHADGRVLATLRALFGAPGKLHAEYFAGRRKLYLGPLQIFLVANLVFFLIEGLFHWNILSTPLSTQVDRMSYRTVTRHMAESVAATKGMTLQELAQGFDPTAAKLARTLVIIFVPLFALGVALITPRRGAVSALVFSLHFLAFLLFFESAFILIMTPFFRGGFDQHIDSIISLVIVSICAGYLWVAARRAFGQGPVRASISALVLVTALGASLFAYRFVNFLLALQAQR